MLTGAKGARHPMGGEEEGRAEGRTHSRSRGGEWTAPSRTRGPKGACGRCASTVDGDRFACVRAATTRTWLVACAAMRSVQRRGWAPKPSTRLRSRPPLCVCVRVMYGGEWRGGSEGRRV